MDQKKLRQLENKCTQEHAPACTSACPMHVDVRAFIASIVQGDFSTAGAILQKRLPFPRIIASICDRPCEVHCKRTEVGEAVAIGELENFCANYLTSPKIKPLPKKKNKVAVVGGGLSGLTVAYELGKKGYPVELFEERDRLGGTIWDYLGETLTEEMIVADLAVLDKLPITIHLNTKVNQSRLTELTEQFAAVYLGWGAKNHTKLNLEFDEATLLSKIEGLFIGGSMIYQPYSAILSVARGRTAAISIDRFIQKVSLTAARVNEGAYQTELFTNVAGVEPLPRVPLDAGSKYSAAGAVAEASRCLQCQCLECVKACPYLHHYDRYPKKHIREVYNNESIVMGIHFANKMINSCNICGLCASVCPNELDVGEVCQQARNSMVKRDKMPPSAFDFPLRDMEFSNGDKAALVKHQSGHGRSKYVLFPGCQLGASEPIRVMETYQYLQQQLTGGVGIMLQCCGVPAQWAGKEQLYQAQLQSLADTWQQMGKPQFITVCPTCHKVLQDNLPQSNPISLWELLVEIGLPELPRQSGTKLALHDPCGSREASSLQQAVRSLINQLGYDLEELGYHGDKTRCCGYGGLMYSSNPPLTTKVIDTRIGESPHHYLTYCATCRDFFASRDKKSFHLLDLIFEKNISTLPKFQWNYSQRWENRRQLKEKLLEKFWGEIMTTNDSFNHIKLVINDQLKQVLNQRFILNEDIQKTIDFAEQTGQKFVNKETGRFLANHKIGYITYWVEYQIEDNHYVIYSAYSHRMDID